jgi:hypothetical protein
MKNVKKFIDELGKHKPLAYFLILCGLGMFFHSFFQLNFIRYFFDVIGADNVIDLVYLFFELFAGIVLVTFGIKLLNNNFLRIVGVEKVFLVFLFLWSLSFIFNGILHILDSVNGFTLNGIILHVEQILLMMQGIANFIAGSILVFFSWNVTKKIVE